MKISNENFAKFFKRTPNQFSEVAWKTTLYLALLLCWGTILVGTYLLLK